MKTFHELGLKKDIADILTRLGFKEPLEVQEKTIPLALQGKNVVITSKTGSGKTLAYLLGFLGKIDRKKGIQMLVMVPTRELCVQVGKEIDKVCSQLGISSGTLYGGRDIRGDFKTTMKKNQILIGTPGRLVQHINDKNIIVGETRYLVFDESDQMFDNGFYEDCAYIKKRVSKGAQIVLASATISPKVQEFVEQEIENHEFLKIGSQIPPNIRQEILSCSIPEKNGILVRFLENKQFSKAIIFCNTKNKSYSIADFLNENGINAKTLNSDFKQKDRENNLNTFKDQKKSVMVTTDVAARGLHIEKVDIVINYDVPTRDEFYVHRIGRTGRNDKQGYALTMICPEDEERFENIEFDYDLKLEEIDKDFNKVKHIKKEYKYETDEDDEKYEEDDE